MSIPFLPSRVATPIPGWMRNDFFIAAVLSVFLTALTYLFATSVGWVTEPNWLEIIASGMNYAATYLSIKQRRFFYLIGISASAVYAVVYGQAGLVASAFLSLYLVISLVYGYLRWGKDGKTRPVHRIKGWWWLAYIGVTGVFWGGAVLLVNLLGGSFAPLDSAILVLTILAQFMLDNKVIETWAVWTLVNIIGATIYFQSGLYFAAVQQVLFGVANLWGFFAWKKTMPKSSDMRVTPVDDPLDYRGDGTIRPGDPAYDFMMEVMNSGKPVLVNRQKDGTWKESTLG